MQLSNHETCPQVSEQVRIQTVSMFSAETEEKSPVPVQRLIPHRVLQWRHIMCACQREQKLTSSESGTNPRVHIRGLCFPPASRSLWSKNSVTLVYVRVCVCVCVRAHHLRGFAAGFYRTHKRARVHWNLKDTLEVFVCMWKCVCARRERGCEHTHTVTFSVFVKLWL